MKTLYAIAAFTCLLAVSNAAEAKVKLSTACKGDLDKFCKDVKKGDGRKACLRTHSAELQADCTSALAAADAAKTKK